MTERARVVLSCHHTLEFTAPPMVGENVYCVRCVAMRTVENAPPEFRIRCRVCGYSRRCGVERLDAEIRASRHHTKTGHRVSIYNGLRRIYIVGQNNPQVVASGVAGKYAEEDAPLDTPPPF
jgi:hypothetical protein